MARLKVQRSGCSYSRQYATLNSLKSHRNRKLSKYCSMRSGKQEPRLPLKHIQNCREISHYFLKVLAL